MADRGKRRKHARERAREHGPEHGPEHSPERIPEHSRAHEEPSNRPHSDSEEAHHSSEEDDQPESKRQPAIIGICGPPGSGKSTLAHLLYAVLAAERKVMMMYTDDFAVSKKKLVPHRDDKLDADRREAFKLDKIHGILYHLRKHGELPPNEGPPLPVNTIKTERALELVGQEAVKAERLKFDELYPIDENQLVVIIEGSQLFREPMIRELIDVMLMLRVSEKECKERRFQSPDYQERSESQWWKSPDYFDTKAWRNFKHQHSHLYEDGDPERGEATKKCKDDRIFLQKQKDIDSDASNTLSWALSKTAQQLEENEKKRKADEKKRKADEKKRKAKERRDSERSQPKQGSPVKRFFQKVASALDIPGQMAQVKEEKRRE